MTQPSVSAFHGSQKYMRLATISAASSSADPQHKGPHQPPAPPVPAQHEDNQQYIAIEQFEEPRNRGSRLGQEMPRKQTSELKMGLSFRNIKLEAEYLPFVNVVTHCVMVIPHNTRAEDFFR